MTEQTDTERLDFLEAWLRWVPGNRREIWNGAAGFQLLERSSEPVDNPQYKLRRAIDTALDREQQDREEQ